MIESITIREGEEEGYFGLELGEDASEEELIVKRSGKIMRGLFYARFGG